MLTDVASAEIRPLAAFSTATADAQINGLGGVQTFPASPPPCDIQHVLASECSHTPEQFAEVALMLEPRGPFWPKSFSTVKAALYRAFGKLLSSFEAKMCSVLPELTACESLEMLTEWEAEYGTLDGCARPEALSLSARRSLVCQARKGYGPRTIQQLEQLLQDALDCPLLRVELSYTSHSAMGTYMGQSLTPSGDGICIKGIGPSPEWPTVHSNMGGDIGEPLKSYDPLFVAPALCPILYSNTPGDWDPVRYPLLVCLLKRHLPAHISWAICP